jgi:hypothetical protein
MKSKGPVDFFLGVFLEFGAAFCLLFFLPQVPWHWLPGEKEPASKTQVSPFRLSPVAATQRRVSLLPSQPALTRTDLSLSPTRREAPPLLPSEIEAVSDTVQFSESTIAQAAPESTRRSTSYYGREFPRRYQY